MHDYHNLLYVSHGTGNETEGLKQALSLARNNKAKLKLLVTTPEFPREFTDHRKKYEESLLEQIEASIQSTKEAIKLEDDSVDTSIELISDKMLSIQIIQQVLQHGYDLVIKEAIPQDNMGGFKAIEMDLLRKCPAPLWLCRPIKHSREHIQVAVAIDPESEEAAAENLSKHMLEISRSLADTCSGTLHIVSCWDYELEEYLRGNIWVKTSEEEIAQIVLQRKQEHRARLDNIIKASGISGSNKVHHLQGKPSELIASFTQNNKIDILVMGTVARTGIAGFIFGNTAENIVQRLTCSVMALKPKGFVSPVKAY